jgi:hypothetical protein
MIMYHCRLGLCKRNVEFQGRNLEPTMIYIGSTCGIAIHGALLYLIHSLRTYILTVEIYIVIKGHL